MQPEDLAKKLPEELGALKIQVMRRLVLTVEKNVKKATRIDTGHLRRSWTSKVERAGERGRVGTTVRYALYQRNKPLQEGLEASEDDIQRILEEAGEDFLQRVIA